MMGDRFKNAWSNITNSIIKVGDNFIVFFQQVSVQAAIIGYILLIPALFIDFLVIFCYICCWLLTLGLLSTYLLPANKVDNNKYVEGFDQKVVIYTTLVVIGTVISIVSFWYPHLFRLFFLVHLMSFITLMVGPKIDDENGT